MGTAIAWIIGQTGLSPKLARAIACSVLILAIVGACAGLIVAYNHHVISAHEAQQVKKAIPAINKAAGERSADAISNSKHEQELHDVVQAQPDQPIAPTSHALACKRLRDAGRAPAACR